MGPFLLLTPHKRYFLNFESSNKFVNFLKGFQALKCGFPKNIFNAFQDYTLDCKQKLEEPRTFKHELQNMTKILKS